MSLILAFSIATINAKENDIDGGSKYLLNKLNSTQVLFIGTPNHTQYGFYKLLENFIKKAVKNNNLKYIVLERPMASNEYLQEVSTLAPGEYSLDHNMAEETLCGSTEWAYAGKNLFPIIQKANQFKTNKVILKSIDGMNSENDFSDTDLSDTAIEINNCKTNKLHESFQFVSSFNRERESANNFKKNIMEKLGPDEKAIVIYNHAHLLKGAKSCMQNFRDGKFMQEDLFSTWLGLYVSENPYFKNKMNVVLIDEEDIIKLNGQQYPGYNGNGILNIKQDYSKLNFFDLGEKSLIWKRSSFVKSYFNDLHFSERHLFDGYIWLPDSKKYNFERDNMREYLPKICKAKK
jgi:hypothetical protein